MPFSPSPCFGRVVWADLRDSITGATFKDRPAVIVSPDDQIRSGGEVWVVAITTKHHLAPAEVQVELDWDPQGHCRSGLRELCWAVCTWVQRIRIDSIRRYGGVLRGAKTAKVIAKMQTLPTGDEPVRPESPSPPEQ